MLLPNAESGTVRVRAGETVTYPEDDVYFEAQPPAGAGMVRAFLTAEPLPIDIPAGELYRTGGEDFAAEVAGALIAAVGTDEGAVSLDSWGTASVVYEIQN
jgi:hypothetical protein